MSKIISKMFKTQEDIEYFMYNYLVKKRKLKEQALNTGYIYSGFSNSYTQTEEGYYITNKEFLNIHRDNY